MNIFLATIVILGLTGLIGAILLYATSKRFDVAVDPREESIRDALPGANCGACGLKGCADFARECVSRGSLDGLNCPGAGAEGMCRVAEILGVTPGAATAGPVAALHCNGSCSARPRPYAYDGAQSCGVMNAVGVGTSGCAYGCLGCGDCVSVCRFGALRMDPETGLPVIDAEKCTGCGLCTAECPRRLIEMRPRGPRGRRVWTACSSRDKGAVARKVCTAACIGCGKCARTCPFEAITVTDNLAYINPDACRACGKCVPVCPTGAIHATFTPVVKNENKDV